MPALVAVVVLYLIGFRAVLRGVDWLILLIFILMFVDLGLLASLPTMTEFAHLLNALPGEAYTAGIVVSQLISNVPAAIFLANFNDQWLYLSWGVNVGGFGLAIGSMANLIALRLARRPGLWSEFHRWSLLMLLLSSAAGLALLMLRF